MEGKERENMGKRPLAFGCLLLIFLLYIACLLSPEVCKNYDAYQGCEVTLAGKVFRKESVRQPNGQILVLYLKDLSGDGEEEAVYEIVEDDSELAAVSNVFQEMLDDVDITM